MGPTRSRVKIVALGVLLVLLLIALCHRSFFRGESPAPSEGSDPAVLPGGISRSDSRQEPSEASSGPVIDVIDLLTGERVAGAQVEIQAAIGEAPGLLRLHEESPGHFAPQGSTDAAPIVVKLMPVSALVVAVVDDGTSAPSSGATIRLRLPGDAVFRETFPSGAASPITLPPVIIRETDDTGSAIFEGLCPGKGYRLEMLG